MRVETLIVVPLILLAACTPDRGPGDRPAYTIGGLLFEDLFDNADTTFWKVESQQEFRLTDRVHDGVLDVDVAGGITIWSGQEFGGDIMFEFEVTAVQRDGPNDRVSDLNYFWMATDPAHPRNFFARSEARGGIFYNYYTLNLYYVGYGGHNNTKTRFRKYNGVAEPVPPVIQEHSDPSHLIIPNRKNVVRIVNFDSTVACYFNGEKIFELHDPQPYREGHFGFRTVDNHMTIDRFSVYSLHRSR